MSIQCFFRVMLPRRKSWYVTTTDRGQLYINSVIHTHKQCLVFASIRHNKGTYIPGGLFLNMQKLLVPPNPKQVFLSAVTSLQCGVLPKNFFFQTITLRPSPIQTGGDWRLNKIVLDSVLLHFHLYLIQIKAPEFS